MTGSEIAVILIIIALVIFVRKGFNKSLDDKFKSYPRVQELREAVKSTKCGVVYTDHYSVGKTEVYFKDYHYPDIDLQTAKELAQYLASALPAGTRYELRKVRADSNWKPSQARSSIATVVVNSHSANAYEGGYSDTPSRGKHIGWNFGVAKKGHKDATGDTEYHRS